MSFRDIIRNKWAKFGFWALLYLLWVIWLGSWWWLLGEAVIFDVFITRKVRWNFWKKRYEEGQKHDVWNDWLDAIVFAVIVVTFINIFFFQAFKIPSSSMESTLYTGDHLFVSKLTYGPRVPETPLTIPFTHNTIFGKKSYSTLIRNKYRRLAGFRQVRRGDCVVFGFPNGDTVLRKAPAEDYHYLVRTLGRKTVIDNFGPVIARPSDKKDHYVKRCVAVAGDSLSVVDGLVWVNGEAQTVWPGVQLSYRVCTKRLNPKTLAKLGLNVSELWYDPSLPGYPMMPLTAQMLPKVKDLPTVTSVEPNLDVCPPDYPDSYLSIFPYTEDSGWTRDNFGPLWIPSKGATVTLDAGNLPLYRRIISEYEHNTLSEEADGKILINGEEAHDYTFKQDYYFMMGDNRHNSLDSRYWGFVPEDHVVGRPVVIWLSTVRGERFPRNIRWGRFLKFV